MRCAGAALWCLLSVVAPPLALPLPTGPPVVGTWGGGVHLPDGQLPNAPLLGNGYLGVVFGSRIGAKPPLARMPSIGPGATGALDMWVGSNAFWACSPLPNTSSNTYAVSARCARRPLGGVSLTTAAAGNQGIGFTSMSAEQHVLLGEVRTILRLGGGGSIVRTSSVAHPEQHVLITTLSRDATAGICNSSGGELLLNVSTWAHTGPYVGAADIVGGLPTASRRLAANGTQPPWTMWGALATRVVTGGNGPARTPVAVLARDSSWDGAVGGIQSVTLRCGGNLTLVTAMADNLRSNHTTDPSTDAAALAASVDPVAARAASAAHWRRFHNASSVRLPKKPGIERYWWGAQYATGAMTPSAKLLQSTGGLAPPSGLYGPWVTSDHPKWNGDYTLDYNQEAQFYGTFSSNHLDLAPGYEAPITAFMPHAAVGAATVAASANLSCIAGTLHFPCHLAPWGFQSVDSSVFMHWNGFYAALPFINHWEYGRNHTTARETTLPLLDGLMRWAHCYLQKVPVVGKQQYTFLDYRAAIPDEEHEKQMVPNPQIALALMLRVARAYLSIGTAVGVSVPAYISDIAEHLSAFNIAPTPFPPPAMPGDAFTLRNNTRCDERAEAAYHIDGQTFLERCETACYNDENCSAFTWCDKTASGCTPAGIPHLPPGSPTCRRFSREAACSVHQTGYISGMLRKTNETRTVWAAYANATRKESDLFALYPVWPSEVVDAIDHRATDALTRTVAALSVRVYAPNLRGRPVTVYSAAVRAGVNVSAGGFSAEEILEGLASWLGRPGGNFVPRAPGGGVENVGVVAAVNDMLVQSPGGRYIVVFPVWPASEPATFTSLRTKGGFLVSATWDNSIRAVSTRGVTVVATADDCTHCTLQGPWAGKAVRVRCGGAAVHATVDGDRVSWPMRKGDRCTITPAPAARRLRQRAKPHMSSAAPTTCALFALSPLLKVMLYGPMPSPLTTPILIAGGETAHFQVAVSGIANVPKGATLEVTLPPALVQMGATYTARWVNHVQVNETDVQQPGYYPDPLPPLPSILGPLNLDERNHAFWISVTMPPNVRPTKPGLHSGGTVRLLTTSDRSSALINCSTATFSVRVFGFALEAKHMQLTMAQFKKRFTDQYFPPSASMMDKATTAMAFFSSLARQRINSLAYMQPDNLPFAMKYAFDDASLKSLTLSTSDFDDWWPKVISIMKPIDGVALPLSVLPLQVKHLLHDNATYAFCVELSVQSTCRKTVQVPVFAPPYNGTLNPTFVDAFTKLIKAVVAHMATAHPNSGPYWVQVDDEPIWVDATTRINVLSLMRLFKRIEPTLKIFQTRFPQGTYGGTGCGPNGTGEVPPEMQEALELVDYWCPHVCQMSQAPGVPKSLAALVARRPEVKVLVYNNGACITPLHTFRTRAQAWSVFATNGTLAGSLSWYNIDFWYGGYDDPADSPWANPKQGSGWGYLLYPPRPSYSDDTKVPGGDGSWEPVESIRWLMLSAGIDDAAYLSALRAAAPHSAALSRVREVAWALPAYWRDSGGMWQDEGYTTNAALVEEVKREVGEALEKALSLAAGR